MNGVFVPTIWKMRTNFVFECFSFFVSTQNQVSHLTTYCLQSKHWVLNKHSQQTVGSVNESKQTKKLFNFKKLRNKNELWKTKTISRNQRKNGKWELQKSKQIRHDFQKQFKNLANLFLGRPNWFSERSQIIIKTPFWHYFLGRRHFLWKRSKTAFLKNF